jgi:hypothetical protein
MFFLSMLFPRFNVADYQAPLLLFHIHGVASSDATCTTISNDGLSAGLLVGGRPVHRRRLDAELRAYLG